jgi:DNA-directed RNA polymerase subunit RPC12/RpoP
MITTIKLKPTACRPTDHMYKPGDAYVGLGAFTLLCAHCRQSVMKTVEPAVYASAIGSHRAVKCPNCGECSQLPNSIP